MTVLLGIDIGQSSCKVSALDEDGVLLGSQRAAYRTAHPRPGWAEQDPEDWIEAATAACSALLHSLPGRRVAAVGFTSATHNAVLLDTGDRPVRPSILLSDARAAEEAAAIERTVGDYVLERTRNSPSAGWTLPQLCWIARHEPDAWRRVRRIVFAKDYVRRSVTGDFVTDWIDAQGSLLLDAESLRWDERLCGEVPLDPSSLPRLCSPLAVVGQSSEGALGLPAGVPVVAGCSDTAAEALAAGANQEGATVVKLATAGNVNVVTANPRPSRAYFTYSHLLEGLVYHSFGTNAAAASRAWLQELLGARTPTDYERIDREVKAIPAGADGLLFHPYLAGERAPVFDPTLRASILGLSTRHTRAHVARAVLEGVALSLADCAGVAAAHGIRMDEIRIIGGGSSSDVWSQIVADVLGRQVVRPALADASSGAALVAGVGAGVFDGVMAAAALTTRATDRFAPVPSRSEGYRVLLHLYREARERIAPLSRALQGDLFPS